MQGKVPDFPVLAVAVSECDSQWKVAIGARPMRAKLAEVEGLLGECPDETAIEAFALKASESVSYQSNMRASAEYRKVLAEVLVGRAVKDILAQKAEQE